MWAVDKRRSQERVTDPTRNKYGSFSSYFRDIFRRILIDNENDRKGMMEKRMDGS
jgi:hypothetical protein